MQRLNSERGSTSILVAALGLALLMATGLAVDGGRKLGALSEARNIADNAARAGHKWSTPTNTEAPECPTSTQRQRRSVLRPFLPSKAIAAWSASRVAPSR